MTSREHAVHGLEIEERFGYWQAVRSGDLVHCAGQVARDAAGEAVGVGDLGRQLDQCFANLRSVLTPVGASLDDLVFVQTHVVTTDAPSWVEDVTAAHRRAVGVPPPAGAVLAVDALNRPEFLAEVSAVAFAPRERGSSMRDREVLQRDNAVETRLGLSTAVRAGGLIFVSGQLPVDSQGDLVEGGLAAQFASCIAGLASVLHDCGGALDDVVYTHTYLTEGITQQSFDAICDAHRDAFDGPNRPSGTMVYVPALPLPGAHVLMTAVAVAR